MSPGAILLAAFAAYIVVSLALVWVHHRWDRLLIETAALAGGALGFAYGVYSFLTQNGLVMFEGLALAIFGVVIFYGHVHSIRHGVSGW
jgi:hypothetical protein